MEEIINERDHRQLEILKKYHEVDEINKIIKVKLHYEKTSDIISSDLSNKDKPVFDADIIDRIHDLLNRFPPDYKLDLELEVDDYEDYDPSLLLDSLCDTLELEQYRTARKIKKTWLFALTLLFIGVALLIILSVLKSIGVIGDKLLSDMVVDYVLDTVACVFIWEFISQLCIYPAEFVVTNIEVFRGIYAISFTNSVGHRLCSVTKEQMASRWVVDNKKEHLGKIFLICTGGLHCILGVIGLVNFFVELHNVDFNDAQIVAYTITVMIVSALQLIYGIGSISRFNGKGPFKTLVFFLSFLLLIAYAAMLGVIIMYAISGAKLSAAVIVSFGAGLIATTLNLIGCFWTRNKQNKIEKNN